MSHLRAHLPRGLARFCSLTLIKFMVIASVALWAGCLSHKTQSGAPAPVSEPPAQQNASTSAPQENAQSPAQTQVQQQEQTSPDTTANSRPQTQTSPPNPTSESNTQSATETREYEAHETVAAQNAQASYPAAAEASSSASSSASASMSESAASSSAAAPAAMAPPPPPIAEDRPTAAAPREPREYSTAAAPPPPAKYEIVRVFYATDRKRTSQLTPARFYGGQRCECDELARGTLDVSIPPDHHVGEIERPFSVWKIEMPEHPEKHVVLLSVNPLAKDQYYRELSQRVDSSPGKDILVFIHGYDNSFEDAAWRAAQLAHDLNFNGAPVLYSWPSKGTKSGYPADEATVEWSTPHLEKFLRELATQSHATTIHVIAHSMGNRALTRALTSIAQDHAAILPMFKDIFLAAPDVDSDVFKQLAAVFPNAASHVTLYASSKDWAIAASRQYHQYARIGDASIMAALTNIEMIDATAVDTGFIGHSYYGDNRSILSDIYAVLHTGGPPSQRFGMKPRPSETNALYWAFAP